MKSLVHSIWEKICNKRKFQLLLLLFLMIISGLSEVITLATLYPFLTALTHPEKLLNNQLILFLFEKFEFKDPRDLLVPITISFGLSALITSLIRLGTLWSNYRIAAYIGSDLSNEAFRKTLYQPYMVHLSLNSSEIISGATTNVSTTTAVIMFLLQMLTSSIVVTGLIISLFFINGFVALLTLIIVGSSYILIAKGTKKKLYLNSKIVAQKLRTQIKCIQESLGAIREVLLSGTQDLYINNYRSSDITLRLTDSQSQFLASFPRYGLEGICMILISFLTIVLIIFQKKESTELISILGTLALGGQRMLPGIQQIYSGWAAVKSNTQSVRYVLDILDQEIPLSEKIEFNKQIGKLEKIEFEKVSFRYDQTLPYIFKDINLTIKKGESIGLVGETGSGKSTLIDLMMGLLKPTSGQIKINGIDINMPENASYLRSWRSSIAHVPQSIFLLDDTIKVNIGLGFNKENIDFKKIKKAASKACISKYIEKLKNGYETYVGERGAKLSGGQLQRVGIARSIYKEYKLLILDEATSALDNKTEEEVISNIHGFNKTTFMIAHRLSTLEKCDRIIKLNYGIIQEIS